MIRTKYYAITLLVFLLGNLFLLSCGKSDKPEDPAPDLSGNLLGKWNYDETFVQVYEANGTFKSAETLQITGGNRAEFIFSAGHFHVLRYSDGQNMSSRDSVAYTRQVNTITFPSLPGEDFTLLEVSPTRLRFVSRQVIRFDGTYRLVEERCTRL